MANVEALVQKLLPLLENKTTLDSSTVSSLLSTLVSEQKQHVLEVLQATIKSWKEKNGDAVVPPEIEKSFELAVASAFAGNKAEVVQNVEAVSVSCWNLFCGRVSAEIPVAEQKVKAAVDSSSLPSAVKNVVDSVVDSVAATAAAEASAVQAAVVVDLSGAVVEKQ